MQSTTYTFCYLLSLIFLNHEKKYKLEDKHKTQVRVECLLLYTLTQTCTYVCFLPLILCFLFFTGYQVTQHFVCGDFDVICILNVRLFRLSTNLKFFFLLCKDLSIRKKKVCNTFIIFYCLRK